MNVSFVGKLVQEYFRREMEACCKTNISYARTVAKNSCSQYPNRNFMQKKALRMNQAVARNVEEPVSSNVVVTAIPDTEKSVRCTKPFVPPVVRKLLFRLNLPVRDRFIAGTVSRPDAIANPIF